MKRILAAAVLAAAPASAEDAAQATPASMVAAAPKSEWKAIDPTDLLVMTLAPDTAGRARQLVIQLIPPPFSQAWVGNVRALAKAHWWDGTSVYRVVDNWVTQWGDGEDDPKKAKPLPKGVRSPPQAAAVAGIYEMGVSAGVLPTVWTNTGWHRFEETFGPSLPPSSKEFFGLGDPYAAGYSFRGGFPIALGFPAGTVLKEAPRHPTVGWPIHCYGTVGVARDLESTGTGAELYAVNGTPPRQPTATSPSSSA